MTSHPTDGPAAVILGAHPFPYGNASANRMLTLAMTWAAAGWQAVVVNDHPDLDDNRRLEVVRNVPFINLGAPTGTHAERLKRRRSLPERVVSTINDLRLSTDVEFIVVPSMMSGPALLRHIAEHLPGVSVIPDAVERHDSAQFPRRGLHTYYVRHRWTSWYAAHTARRAIVISAALAQGPYAQNNPLVIPACVDVEEFSEVAERARDSSQVRVTYFGSPGTKDDLSALLLAIPKLPPSDRALLVVTLAGFRAEDLPHLPGMTPRAVAAARGNLLMPGMLPRAGVRDLLAASHFTYLMRDPAAGFARYGFPTKISESLAAGCPPIANLTSDLGDYLTDGENAIVTMSTDSEAVCLSLWRAVDAVRSGRHRHLQAEARRTAELKLAPASFAAELRKWAIRVAD